MIRPMIAMLVFAVALQAQQKPEKHWMFIGTGTVGKSTSKGIYRAEFDAEKGTFTPPVLVAEVTNPTFLVIHPNQKNLYCVGEVNSTGGKKAGGVHAFSIDATGKLKKLNDSDSGGPGPCHLTTDRKGECLLVANYSGGSVKCLKLNADGSIGKESSFIQHEGKGTDPKRQEGPHAHSVNVSPDNKFAIVADLGCDKLFVYKLDPKMAKLTAHEPASADTPPGSGPRHFSWHPNGKRAYANGEMTSTVISLEFDADAGQFRLTDSVSSLPDNVTAAVAAGNTTAEILVHPDGKHLFVSNRGHNSIGHFTINDNGSLAPAGFILGEIKTPRNFNIDPSGRWLVVANQDGDNIVAINWERAKGQGNTSGGKIMVARPMCVKFVEK